MAQETTNTTVDEQGVQATSPGGDVDYEALYHKEKKYSQSLRSRAQDAEGNSEKLSLQAEEERQGKLIAEGKKDDLIIELKEKAKAAESRLSVFQKQESQKRETLLENIPEDDRVHYENMNLNQLEHFVNQSQSPDVSNPAEAVQGRTNVNYSLDSFMGETDKYKRDNFGDILKNYEQKSASKTKVT